MRNPTDNFTRFRIVSLVSRLQFILIVCRRYSGSHGAFIRGPLGCLVVSALRTDCCVSRIERNRRVIAALSVA
jgi:hypothetical protein